MAPNETEWQATSFITLTVNVTYFYFEILLPGRVSTLQVSNKSIHILVPGEIGLFCLSGLNGSSDGFSEW